MKPCPVIFLVQKEFKLPGNRRSTPLPPIGLIIGRKSADLSSSEIAKDTVVRLGVDPFLLSVCRNNDFDSLQ